MRARSGPRIAIVGSCQGPGLGAWMQSMLPDADVAAWHVGSRSAPGRAQILSALRGRDLIVTQLQPGFQDGAFDLSVLQRLGGKVLFLPMLTFAGFHPDMVYRVRAADGGVLEGAMGPLHSAVVLAAFRLGVPADQVARLFNSMVFAAAGYFEVFADSRAAMIDLFSGHGYALEGPFDAWLASGAFMHTENHPHIRVLRTLAGQALAMAGLVPADAVDAPPDRLANSFRWPIYPDIARRLGVDGGFAFQCGADIRDGGGSTLDLQDFIDASFRLYACHGMMVFRHDVRVEQTLAALQTLLA